MPAAILASPNSPTSHYSAKEVEAARATVEHMLKLSTHSVVNNGLINKVSGAAASLLVEHCAPKLMTNFLRLSEKLNNLRDNLN